MRCHSWQFGRLLASGILSQMNQDVKSGHWSKIDWACYYLKQTNNLLHSNVLVYNFKDCQRISFGYSERLRVVVNQRLFCYRAVVVTRSNREGSRCWNARNPLNRIMEFRNAEELMGTPSNLPIDGWWQQAILSRATVSGVFAFENFLLYSFSTHCFAFDLCFSFSSLSSRECCQVATGNRARRFKVINCKN